MPSTGTHRYGAGIPLISRGTIAVNGTLTLPTGSGVTTFNLGPSVYYEAGIYTLYTFLSLAGGTVPTNFAVNGAGLPSGLTAGVPYREGNTIKVVISSS